MKQRLKKRPSAAMSLLLAAVLCLSILGACAESTTPASNMTASPPPSETAGATDDKTNEAAVRKLVEDFGQKLKNVSLLAPAADLVKSIEDNYAAFVTPELLAAWKADPANTAPGRLTSSPWPDRIEIGSVVKNADGSYTVTGNVIEVTSTEAGTGEAADTRPVTLKATSSTGHWLISEWSLGAPVMSGSIVYSNTDYGFDFTLPKDWKGYTIVSEEWKGTPVGDTGTSASGPQVLIRSPKWTAETPTQDIPIMVFTLQQWDDLQKEKFAVSAAPIPPSELGRNSKYVFALPPRYNYAFPAGYEEVEQILSGKPLKATENFK